MSLAQPEVGSALDLSLIEQIESAIPCQVEAVSTNMDACPNQASFLVVFKTSCDHGSPLPPGDPLVCGTHAAWLASGAYGCGGCQCPVAPLGWGHLIVSFKEI